MTKISWSRKSLQDCDYVELGGDRNPVLICDNFLENFDEVARLSKQIPYTHPLYIGGYYPGYVAPANFIEGLGELRASLAYEVVRRRYSQTFDESRADFLTNQRLLAGGETFFAVYAPSSSTDYLSIHTDTHCWLAVVLYLGEASDGSGTGLWKHKPLQLQSFPEGADVMRYHLIHKVFGVDSIENIAQLLGEDPTLTYAKAQELLTPGPRKVDEFPKESDNTWELLMKVEARPNRLVVYPAWQWHSIIPGKAVESAPISIHSARRTLNVFIPLPFEMEVPPPAEVEGIRLR